MIRDVHKVALESHMVWQVGGTEVLNTSPPVEAFWSLVNYRVSAKALIHSRLYDYKAAQTTTWFNNIHVRQGSTRHTLCRRWIQRQAVAQTAGKTVKVMHISNLQSNTLITGQSYVWHNYRIKDWKEAKP